MTSSDATFVSNQVIGGVGGAGNLGASGSVDFRVIAGNQFVTVPVTAVPEPASFAALTVCGLIAYRRRRKNGNEKQHQPSEF